MCVSSLACEVKAEVTAMNVSRGMAMVAICCALCVGTDHGLVEALKIGGRLVPSPFSSASSPEVGDGDGGQPIGTVRYGGASPALRGFLARNGMLAYEQSFASAGYELVRDVALASEEK